MQPSRAAVTAPRSLKGKLAARRNSWSDLPPALLRHIVDFVISGSPPWPVVPEAWKERHFHAQQTIWSTLALVHAVASVRVVCRNWEVAMQTHWLYNSACHNIDPYWQDSQWLVQVPRLPNSRQSSAGGARGAVTEIDETKRPQRRTHSHFQSTLKRCCLTCRLASPLNSWGTNSAVESFTSRSFGDVMVCDKHRSEPICSLCLKDEYIDSWRVHEGRMIADLKYRTIHMVEDEDCLRGVGATCRSCRATIVQHFMRGRITNQNKNIIEQVVEPFLECGEGTFKEMYADIDEKVWLYAHTNYNELHESAIAVEKMRIKQELRAEREAENMAGGGTEARLQELLDRNADPAAIEEALAMQTVDDDEDDELLDDEFGEILSAAEENNVLDIALSGWARTRIMDGCWISPYDIFQGQAGTRVKTELLHSARPAWHPVNSLLNAGQPGRTAPIQSGGAAPAAPHRPRISAIRCPVPPPKIHQRAQWHYEHSLRQILMPAMNNLVQRLVYESELDNKDVCRMAITFNSPILLEELMTVQLWGKEYDWSNCQTSPTITSTTTIESASDRDSPPTTVRTTPSPSPPANASPKSAAGVFATAQQEHPRASRYASPPSTIPLPLPARFVDHIPYVPQSELHVGANTHHLVNALWREACSGLFKCQCSICLRAAGITEAREHARRRAREEEAAVAAAAKLRLVPLRQKAPPPPSPPVHHRMQTPPPSSPTDMVEEEEGELRSSTNNSQSQSPMPLRRSRTATSDDEEEENPRDAKRIKFTPPTLAATRRSQDEVESTPQESDPSRAIKKIRIARRD